MIISYFYFIHSEETFDALEGAESILGGFFGGVFWLRTREMNSRIFFKLKIFYLTLFNVLLSFTFLAIFYKMKFFLSFTFEETIYLFGFSLILTLTGAFKLYLSNFFEELIFLLLFSMQGWFVYTSTLIAQLLVNQDLSILEILYRAVSFVLPKIIILFFLLVCG